MRPPPETQPPPPQPPPRERRRGMETGWLMVAVGVCLLLATEPGARWTKAAVTAVPGWWWSAWSSSASEDGGGAAAGTEVAEREVQMQLSDEEERMQEEQMEVLRTITDHCLPKLVCELYSKQLRSSLTDHEVSLMQLIGVTSLNPSGPSKYHFAAHMGQLIRGVEGTGCHEFYPSCPFTGEDVRHIARKIQVR